MLTKFFQTQTACRYGILSIRSGLSQSSWCIGY